MYLLPKKKIHMLLHGHDYAILDELVTVRIEGTRLYLAVNFNSGVPPRRCAMYSKDHGKET